MMEEQNQEKVTATRHAKTAGAVTPETGNGRKKDKGGGEKEEKTVRPLMPKQLQQRKRLMVYPLMGLPFLGLMWLISAPSEEREVNQNIVGAFNTDIPLPENDRIVGDEWKAYEQAQAEKRQIKEVRSLEDFAFSEENDADGVETELSDSEPEREPFRDYSGNGGGRSPVAAYWDINRKLGLFYEGPKVDGEKEELKGQAEGLTAKLEEGERQMGGIDDQVALMKKSYKLATKYMGQSGQDGATVQTPAIVQNGNSLEQLAVTVQAARERTVSGLQQPLSDAEFMRRYSQSRDYGFNTAVGSGYVSGKNTIAACVHQDQTVADDQQMKPRLLEPLQVEDLTILRNTMVSGTGKVQGERLGITVSSVRYQGNILSVELTVYNNRGMKGPYIETSPEWEMAKEAMANIGGGLGTSILFVRSAGQQVAVDITRGLIQGGSQYLAKRFHTVKVHLRTGDLLMLYAKQQ